MSGLVTGISGERITYIKPLDQNDTHARVNTSCTTGEGPFGTKHRAPHPHTRTRMCSLGWETAQIVCRHGGYVHNLWSSGARTLAVTTTLCISTLVTTVRSRLWRSTPEKSR